MLTCINLVEIKHVQLRKSRAPRAKEINHNNSEIDKKEDSPKKSSRLGERDITETLSKYNQNICFMRRFVYLYPLVKKVYN